MLHVLCARPQQFGATPEYIGYSVKYIVSYLAATAMAMAMAMLKIDENVNLRLELHVNRALFYYLRLSSWHRFVYFSKYWVATDRKHNGRKGS